MEIYYRITSATNLAVTPLDNGTITQIAVVLFAGVAGFKVGFDPTGAVPVLSFAAPSANDLALILPVKIPIRKGEKFFVTADSVVLTVQ